MSCSGKHELHFKVALLISLFVFGNKQVFDFWTDSFFGPGIWEDAVRGAIVMYPE